MKLQDENIIDQSRHQLTVQEKWNIVAMMWKEYNPASKSYPENVYDIVARSTHVSSSTVRNVINEYNEKLVNSEGAVPDLTPKPHGHRESRLPSYSHDLHDAFMDSKGHFYYDEQSEKLNIPKTTLFRWMHDLGIQTSTSYIKPTLTLMQKIKRITFILHKLEDPKLAEDYLSDKVNYNGEYQFKFKSFKNIVWVDEAWFYLKHIQLPMKRLPDCPRFKDDTTASKTHIPKVMFLMAVGLPQQRAYQSADVFNGRLGIWPIVKEVPAKRNSKNRPKGAIENKPLAMVGPEYANILIKPETGLFDSLLRAGDKQDIPHWIVQQDGAKPHISKHVVPTITVAGHEGRRNIDVITQPPQSPDLNLLDLAYIHSIQSAAKRLKYSVNSVDEFIEQVTTAFQQYPDDKLLRICALQLVAYREILKDFGGNQYDMQHTGIRTRQMTNVKNGGSIYADISDYNINADLVRGAVEFYETHMHKSFPWSTHPNYPLSVVPGVHEEAIVNPVDGGVNPVDGAYFDPYSDSDDADDPYNDDRSVDEEYDEVIDV